MLPRSNLAEQLATVNCSRAESTKGIGWGYFMVNILKRLLTEVDVTSSWGFNINDCKQESEQEQIFNAPTESRGYV